MARGLSAEGRHPCLQDEVRVLDFQHGELAVTVERVLYAVQGYHVWVAESGS